MAKQSTFKRKSARATRLLARQEDVDVEFKESVGSVDQRLIVAFANSGKGGTILVGIREERTREGLQKPIIVGCEVGDRSKQAILSRASDCVPPVNVEICVENTARKPFLRLEIPSGHDKPYCTGGGTYQVRGNGRNDPLFPTALLAMFADHDAEKFIDRYRRAVGPLEDEVKLMTREVASEISRVALAMENTDDSIADFQREIENRFEGILNSLGFTEHFADEAMSSTGEMSGSLDEMRFEIDELKHLLIRVQSISETLLPHFGIEDPYVTRDKIAFQGGVYFFLTEGSEDQLEAFIRSSVRDTGYPSERLNEWADQVRQSISDESTENC